MAYEYSTNWSPNYEAGGAKVGIVVHHAGGTDFKGIGNTFKNPAREASAHYGVAPGKVEQYVHEDCTAWHAGDTWANHNTIGIECVNSGGEPGWPVAEGTVDTLVELMAEIAKRHGMGRLVRNVNVWGHKDFSATMCPGVLYDRLDEICERANRIIEGGSGRATLAAYNPSNKAQQFEIREDKDGYCTIKSVSTGKFLAYAGGDTADKTNAIFWNETKAYDQKWRIQVVRQHFGTYVVLRPKNDTKKRITTAGYAEVGDTLWIGTDTGTVYGKWDVKTLSSKNGVRRVAILNRKTFNALTCE